MKYLTLRVMNLDIMNPAMPDKTPDMIFAAVRECIERDFKIIYESWKKIKIYTKRDGTKQVSDAMQCIDKDKRKLSRLVKSTLMNDLLHILIKCSLKIYTFFRSVYISRPIEM